MEIKQDIYIYIYIYIYGLNRRQGAEINNFTNFYKSLISSKALRLPQFESEKMYLVLYTD